MASLSTLLAGSALLPIIQAETPAQAVNIAKALQQGGVSAVEVVLRTASALDSISAIRHALPTLQVGAGTILSAENALDAKAAGAQFLVSPACSDKLLSAMINTGLPLAPGVANPAAILMALEFGLTELKFFPAHLSGGSAMLQALQSVFSTVQFCPTGGIGQHNLAEFLALSNVFVVGGSWLTPSALVQQQDWQAIQQLATQACAIAATVARSQTRAA